MKANENARDLLAGQHDRQALGTLCAHESSQSLRRAMEDGAIQKQDRGKRLVLRRTTDAFDGRQMREERLHIVGAELLGMAQAMVDHEPADPTTVGLRGARRVPSHADLIPHTIEEPRRCHGTRVGEMRANACYRPRG